MENALWGFIGVFTGAFLTAIIQLITNKMRLKHETEQARRSHLIEQRKINLLPLREALSEWLFYSQQFLGHVVCLKEDPSIKKDSELYKQIYAEFKEVGNNEEKARKQLYIALNQVSDPELLNRIRLLENYKLDNSGVIYSIITKMMNSTVPSTEKLSIFPDEYRPIRTKIDEFMLSVNARIEQLLSGD